MDTSHESEPALELHSRAAPSVDAHHSAVGPDTGRNSGGRWIIEKKLRPGLTEGAKWLVFIKHLQILKKCVWK